MDLAFQVNKDENEDSEITGEAVIFEILWRWKSDYYIMNMSAFSEENEILLGDGC